MRPFTNLRGLIIIIFAAVAAACSTRADMANGAYTNSFTGADRIWYLGGSYSGSLDGISLNYNISMDPDGKFSGSGTASIHGYFEGAYIDLDMNLSLGGKVSGSSTVTRVNMSMKMDGSGTLQGTAFTFKASANEKCEVDSSTRSLVGTVTGKVKVTVPSLHKSRGAKIPREDFQLTLPVEDDGQWKLTMNLAPNGKKYAGTGAVELSNGISYPLTAAGSYSPKTGLSKISLKQTGNRHPVSLTVQGTSSELAIAIKKLTGKALGQKVKIQPAP